MDAASPPLGFDRPHLEPTPVERLPSSVRAAFALVEDAQRNGAEILGEDGASDRARRYELSEHGIVYFTDATRPHGSAAVLMIVFAIVGLVGLIGGAVLIAEDSSWALPTAALGGLLLYAATRAAARDSAQTARRRAGVETEGLYLLPDALVIRGAAGCQAFPRHLIAGFRKYQDGRQQHDAGYHEELLYRDAPAGEVRAFRLDHTECEALRERCQRWLQS